MKNLLNVIIIIFLTTFLLETTCFAASYQIDAFVGTNPLPKSFDQQFNVSLGSQFSLDIYMSVIGIVPPDARSGGIWVDFTGSTDKISYISCGRYFLDGTEAGPGPWDSSAGFIANEPDGPGTLMVTVANLASIGPDPEGDFLIARVNFERIGVNVGDAYITVSTGQCPSYTMWGPSPPWNDATISEASITIYLDTDNDGVNEGEDNCPNTSNPDQLDTRPTGGNGCGDACECEADLTGDLSVDGLDTVQYLDDLPRNPFGDRPCTNLDPCPGDLNCDESVDGLDTIIYLEDLPRNPFNNPCPACSRDGFPCPAP